MKYLTLLVLLSSCSLIPSSGVTAKDTGNSLVITNNLSVDLVQNTVALTGSDKLFVPDSKTCSLKDKSLFIWSCNLGVIKKEFVLPYKGTFVSGNLFSYDSTQKFYPAIFSK